MSQKYFSWPKARHKSRRLASKVFLERYDSLFKKEKRIVMKTDNRHLFEFSLKELTDYDYRIEEVCLDIYSEDLTDNIATEYENKYKDKGPIYKVIAHKKEKG